MKWTWRHQLTHIIRWTAMKHSQQQNVDTWFFERSLDLILTHKCKHSRDEEEDTDNLTSDSTEHERWLRNIAREELSDNRSAPGQRHKTSDNIPSPTILLHLEQGHHGRRRPETSESRWARDGRLQSTDHIATRLYWYFASRLFWLLHIKIVLINSHQDCSDYFTSRLFWLLRVRWYDRTMHKSTNVVE